MKLSEMAACAPCASRHEGERTSGTVEPHDINIVANIDTRNCIGCTKGDKPMHTDSKSTLSANDVQYIRNLLAEGIARMLVEKVAKRSDLAVDGLEPERYNPSTKKGGTL